MKASRLHWSGHLEKYRFRVDLIVSVKQVMYALFRVDAGPQIGLGHLQRCLSLAKALSSEGNASHFVIRGNKAAYDMITGSGFSVTEIPPNSTLEADLSFTLNCLGRDKAQVMLVDCRAVNCDYLWELRKAGYFVVSIDDLAEIIFPSHLIVNSNIFSRDLPYSTVNRDTRFLLGTDFVMLRPEFWDVPPRVVGASVRNILVTMGGVDRFNLMSKLLAVLDHLPDDFDVTVIVGPFFENLHEIEEASRQSKRLVKLIYAPQSVRDIMLEADLAIAGGGQTLYELACLGCPTVALQVAPDQRQHLLALAEAGVINLGGCTNDSPLTEVCRIVQLILADREARTVMCTTAQRLVDGKGAQRVAQTIVAEVQKGKYLALNSPP